MKRLIVGIILVAFVAVSAGPVYAAAAKPKQEQKQTKKKAAAKNKKGAWVRFKEGCSDLNQKIQDKTRVKCTAERKKAGKCTCLENDRKAGRCKETCSEENKKAGKCMEAQKQVKKVEKKGTKTK